jgi:diphthamide synthase subunit DPH2
LGQPYLQSSASIAKEVKSLIVKSSKKAYQIKLGQMTIEKLGNYSFVDTFVLVDCQFSFPLGKPMINKPMVSPYELINALSDAEWQPMMLLNNDDVEIRPTPAVPIEAAPEKEESQLVKLPE